MVREDSIQAQSLEADAGKPVDGGETEAQDRSADRDGSERATDHLGVLAREAFYRIQPPCLTYRRAVIALAQRPVDRLTM